MQIVDLFYNLAREHKKIKAFFYGRTYEKGTGNEMHPLLWLDDPLYGVSNNQTLQYTCNVDILGIPENDSDVLNVQDSALSVGLTIAEKIKTSYTKTGFTINSLSFVTLRNYYDNNAAGIRFTYTVNQANPVDRCNDDFDPDKQFTKPSDLPDFKTDHPEGCAIFSDKPGLPNFRTDNPQGCATFTKNE